MPHEWIDIITDFKNNLEHYRKAGVSLDVAITAYFMKMQHETYEDILGKLDEIKVAIQESGPPGPK